MIEGQFYHIYNRGNNREDIFLEEKNYMYFLQKFDKYLGDKVSIYSYCLMPNHFHFLIKINEGLNLSAKNNSGLTILEKSFKNFFISYAKSVNKKYKRTGSLFQYKFKRKLVDDYGYLTALISYIHQNPIRAQLCDKEEDWKFSSYKDITENIEKRLDIKIRIKEVLELFDGLSGFHEYNSNYKDYIKTRDFLFNA